MSQNAARRRESAMSRYRAIVLDLDGTLVGEDGHIHPRTLAELRRIAAAGTVVMVATGRSEGSAAAVLEELGLETPAILYNGAAAYCPRKRQLLSSRTMGLELLEKILRYADECGHARVVMCAGAKYALAPRTQAEQLALNDFKQLVLVDDAGLRRTDAIRVTLLSSEYAMPGDFEVELKRHVSEDVYLTSFPLRLLPAHRASPLTVLDIHPPCLGKAEALVLLEQCYGIAAHEVIAVGDATNDLPMLERAGLSVAMELSMPEVYAVADRVIGHCDSDTIAQLVAELFPASSPETR
ncbi:MAG: HAD family hydrolase [Planctomycetota bacterium]